MLRIVTDGAADLLPDWSKKYNIDIIPINIMFGEKSYLQGVDLDNEGFYSIVEENKIIPKTSQPTPHQFIEFYRKNASKGDTILSIHITAKLSGTYASAVSAAEELKDEFKVIPIDSANGSLGIGMLCREARKLEKAGKSVDEIVKYIEGIKNKVRIILTLDTLEYAKMSGRVKTLQAALASLLNVKPIAILKDGDLSMTEKVRTRRAALERVIEIGKEEYGNNPVYLGVVHARDLKSGQSLLDEAKKIFNHKETMISELSISIAANLGPGTVGLVLYPVG
ncbi:MAG: DegV family protein [Anaerolineae bacterium]|nr:DegV family protein [Anaerolineae bacterium]MDK1080860.1 DegV family protein [Anaerolineae bacterium]MDK1117665.1 DegV family protein [Anaerolineae bacterium]